MSKSESPAADPCSHPSHPSTQDSSPSTTYENYTTKRVKRRRVKGGAGGSKQPGSFSSFPVDWRKKNLLPGERIRDEGGAVAMGMGKGASAGENTAVSVGEGRKLRKMPEFEESWLRGKNKMEAKVEARGGVFLDEDAEVLNDAKVLEAATRELGKPRKWEYFFEKCRIAMEETEKREEGRGDGGGGKGGCLKFTTRGG